MAHKIRVITVLTVVFSFWAIGVSAQDLNEGIVGYWPLDGNGKDESGNGNDAKLEKGAVWSDNGGEVFNLVGLYITGTAING